MQFLTSHIKADATTYEKVLLQLLAGYHFICKGLKFKVREPLTANDTGQEAIISRVGPYTAADGTTRITYTVHFELNEDVDGETYSMVYEAAKEMSTAAASVNFIA